MTVISVIINESIEQVMAGIPKTISISANIPATIFYTLDGTDPTLLSTIYTGPIFLPFNKLLITLKVLATNGSDSSPIIVESYMTNMVNGNARLPHAATTAQAGNVIPDAYPFGTPPFQPQQGYLNPADSGITVYNPALPATATGFGADGYPTGYTNQPYNIENYQIRYTTTDQEGQTGIGIGTLPATTKIIPPIPDPEQSDQFTATFNPRAFVIFQDFSKENPNDPPQINRQFFTLEDPEKARDGVFFFNTGQENATVSGSFVNSHFNPRTNMITHYYRDSWTNKWLISTSPFQPNPNNTGNMAGAVMGRNSRVFEWIPYARRVLF